MKTLIIILSLILSSTANAGKVEEFVFRNAGSFTIISGVADVKKGLITARVYCNDRYLGNGTTSIKHHAFKITVSGNCPDKLKMKYAIDKR